MKKIARSEFGYSKPSPSFLLQLRASRVDMSWFKWEDMTTISEEQKLQLKRRAND
jgi:hypothetical protein